jgi:hypothetical protein
VSTPQATRKASNSLPRLRKCRADRYGRDAGVRRWRQYSASSHPSPGVDRAKPITRSLLQPGLVVWVPIPYADGVGWKIRPAVVASVIGRLVQVMPGYSTPTRGRYAEQYVELSDLAGSGLVRATGVRRRLVSVDVAQILTVLGRLSAGEWTRICRLVPSIACTGDLHG